MPPRMAAPIALVSLIVATLTVALPTVAGSGGDPRGPAGVVDHDIFFDCGPQGPIVGAMAEIPGGPSLGDADENGIVDSRDALLVLQCLAGRLGNQAIPVRLPGSADASLDGVLSAVDAALMLQHGAGLLRLDELHPTPTNTPTDTPTPTPTLLSTPTPTPTRTTMPALTPTPTPTPSGPPSPTKLPEPADTDGDGCSDQRESGTDETLGGRRDHENPWDFYDVHGPNLGPPDGQVDLFNDVAVVGAHYSPQGQPPYDVRYDRGPSEGPNPWNMTAPDGKIDLINDIVGVTVQYGHDCR